MELGQAIFKKQKEMIFKYCVQNQWICTATRSESEHRTTTISEIGKNTDIAQSSRMHRAIVQQGWDTNIEVSYQTYHMKFHFCAIKVALS